MTQEIVKKSTKPKVGKSPAEKSESSAKKPEPKKAAAKKDAPTAGKVRLTQVIGSIGRRSDQQATLIGLRLNKRHRVSVLEDTPEVRGMINKVRHLLKVETA